jgi:hypothetical protein
VVGEATVLVEIDNHETAKLQELVAKVHGARKQWKLTCCPSIAIAGWNHRNV